MLNRFVRSDNPTMYAGVPTGSVLRLVAGVLRSQVPTSRPGDVIAPAWFHTWMRCYADGQDMAHF